MATSEKDIKSLESRIKKAISEIKSGEKSPKEAEIGKLLIHLKGFDEAAYTNMLEQYKPVSNAYYGLLDNPDLPKQILIQPSEAYKKSPEYKKSKIYLLSDEYRRSAEYKKQREKDEAAALSGGGGGGDYDVDVTRGPRADKAKVLKPKKEAKVKVPKAQKPLKEKGDRDRTDYTFEGEVYRKGPLVHAIIRKHATLNPKMTFVLMKKDFPDELLKGYGVFQSYERAMEVSKGTKRFFLNDDQLIRLKDGNIAVCNQISAANFDPILAQARKLGYKID
jgi:hypothetical protein